MPHIYTVWTTSKFTVNYLQFKCAHLSDQIFIILLVPQGPHRGLPPCRGGGAYAPMTRTICNLKERS